MDGGMKSEKLVLSQILQDLQMMMDVLSALLDLESFQIMKRVLRHGPG